MGIQAREGEQRGQGIPRSEEEREQRHALLYPDQPLPPRGSGLVGSVGQTAVTVNYGPYLMTGIFSLISALIIARAYMTRK